MSSCDCHYQTVFACVPLCQRNFAIFHLSHQTESVHRFSAPPVHLLISSNVSFCTTAMMKLTLTSSTLALVIAIFSLISCTVRCQTVLVPSKLHVGENNTLLLISESDSSAILNLYEKGQKVPALSQTVYFQKGQLVEWALFLDNTIANKDKVSITLTFENGAKSVEDFEVSPINGFVFFQTDKPIYRVSETVRFRVLRLDRSLSPINEKVVLKIQNHQKIKVDEVSLQTEPPMHIAEHSFNFPLIAKPGTWSAEINYGPNLQLTQSTAFDVTEYVLPLFKTEIFTPKFIFETDLQMKIGVNVSYTYGKPVRGTLHFRFGIVVENNLRTLGSSNTFCFDNGTFSYLADLTSINLSGISEGGPVKFMVEAIVKECASGTIERTQDTRMLVVRKPYIISFRKTIRRYKRMVNNYITFEVVNPHNEPVAGVPIDLTMTTKGDKGIDLPLQPYIVSIDNSNNGQKLKTDQNGQVIFLFKITDNRIIDDIKVEVKTNDPKYDYSKQASDSFNIQPFNSSEQDFVWIENKKRLSYSVGDHFESSIKLNGNLDSFYLAVMSKGTVVYKEKLASTEISFEFTNRMVPSVRVLLIAFTAGGNKYVADSVKLDINQGNCGVTIGLPESAKNILPGQKVTFSIKGNQGDVIGIHAVDEAIYVLRNEKNSSLTKYMQSLKHSDSGCGTGGGVNSFGVIRSAGFKVLSPSSEHKFVDDYCKQSSRRKRATKVKIPVSKKYLEQCCALASAPVNVRRSCEQKRKIVLEIEGSEECANEFLRCCIKDGPRQFQASVQKVSTATINEKTIPKIENDANDGDPNLVRQDFRDTWLFDLILLEQSESTFTSPTPHSITSWFISTMSISPKHGFCLNSQHKVTTFKPFFIHVAFPQTIVQHEQTEISVTLFNYLRAPNSKRLNIRVTYHQVKGICGDGSGKRIIRNVYLDEMSSTRITFPIVPLHIGVFQIKIKAESMESSAIDTVIKNLTVIAPGIEKEKQLTFDLDPLNRAKRSTKVENEHFTDLTIPSDAYQNTTIKLKAHNQQISTGLNIVPKTLHYVVTAVGERFSPQINSIEQLSELIKKPKGCGEQNMYYMSFNLFTMIYLDKIGKLSPQLKEKGVRYLKRALTQELSFRKEDGSFSAFHKRGPSVWLTGFVAKVICQSSPFIGHEIDSQIIISALKWLREAQSTEGYWKEVNPILHGNALGGVQGIVQLTSYLVIVFNECSHYLNYYKVNNNDIQETIRKANSYILEELKTNDNLSKLEYFSQALIAYSLTFSKPSNQKAKNVKEKLIEKLLKNSTIERKVNYQYWKSDYPVETASYALMAIIKSRTDILEYISILNWLSSQEKKGTFDNTQDTIVALEALAKYNVLYKQQEDSQVQLNTNVTFKYMNEKLRLKRSLFFDNNNADVLQTIQVDNDTKEIEFKTRGNGLGKVSLLIIYNEYNPNGTCKFTLDVNVFEFKANSANNVQTAQDHDVDEGLLFANPEKLKTELTVKKEFQETKRKKNFDQPKMPFDELTNCCTSSRLAKRSIPFQTPNFWKSLANTFSRQSTGNGNVHSKRSEPKQKEQPNFDALFPSTPSLGDNPVILVLNICVRHETLYQEMAILEVSILSGYKPIEIDLKNLQKNDSNFIEHYDIGNSKVTFYFRTVPHARIYCLLFRIYREHIVEKIQSALVRIYSYYNQEWMCTRLYSDVRKSNFLDVKCNDDKCRCVTNKKCPDSSKINQILREYSSNYMEIDRNFKDIICEYKNVISGDIVEIGQSNDTYKTPFLKIAIDTQILGDVNGEVLIIRFNPECTSYVPKDKSRVIILHNPNGEELYSSSDSTIWLLEGASMFMPLDARSSSTLNIHVRTFNKTKYRCQI